MRSTSEPEGIINVLGDIALFMYLILYMSKYDKKYVKIEYMSENLDSTKICKQRIVKDKTAKKNLIYSK